MRVSVLPDNLVQVRFAGPLGGMAGAIRGRLRRFLETALHLRVTASSDLASGGARDLSAPLPSPTSHEKKSRVVAIVEVLWQPILLIAQALAFLVVSVVLLTGLVMWAMWRVLCRLIKPALVLAGMAALIGIGAFGGFAYSEYRHPAIHAAADLSDPYESHPSGSPMRPSPSPLPPVNELFSTPPASVPAPRQR
jgi:hypothetical protein